MGGFLMGWPMGACNAGETTCAARVALRHRILAVNVFAIVILAGSLFYLDSFRSRAGQRPR